MKTYNIVNIKELYIKKSKNNKITYWTKINQDIKRIGKAYFFVLKNKNIEIFQKMQQLLPKNKCTSLVDILLIWKEKVYGKKLNGRVTNTLFSGASGHGLELGFGLKINNKNISDFQNYELKLFSKKITYGDWKGIFLWETNLNLSRTNFLECFGRYNKLKKRYYWTSSVVPLFGDVSERGIFWELNKDKLILWYDGKKDLNKIVVKNKNFCKKIILVSWELNILKRKYLNKFSKEIILAKKIQGVHKELLVVKSMSWTIFLEKFTNKIIKLDPCLSTKCARNRCLFRISSKQLLLQSYDKYTIVNNKIVKERVEAKNLV